MAVVWFFVRSNKVFWFFREVVVWRVFFLDCIRGAQKKTLRISLTQRRLWQVNAQRYGANLHEVLVATPPARSARESVAPLDISASQTSRYQGAGN